MSSVLITERMLRDPRLLPLMEETGRGRAELIGLLTLFWLKTRRMARRFVLEGEAVDVVALPRADCLGFLQAMVRAGYLDAVGEELHIPGSEKYLATASKRQESARRAGKASAKKRASQRRPKKTPPVQVAQPLVPDAPAPVADAQQAPLALVQAQPATAAKTATTPGSEAFRAYAEAYTARWGTQPLRDARINALFVQITKRLGAEAPDIMRFYVSHDDRQYVHKLHPVELALRDAQALHAQYKRQRVMTFAEAQAAERGESAQALAVRRQLADIARGTI